MDKEARKKEEKLPVTEKKSEKLAKEEEKPQQKIKPENYFWLANGSVIKNLGEVLDTLKIIDDTTFGHHVNEQKNDFANWIRDIIKDNDLADKMSKAKTRGDMINILIAREKEKGKKPKLVEKKEEEVKEKKPVAEKRPEKPMLKQKVKRAALAEEKKREEKKEPSLVKPGEGKVFTIPLRKAFRKSKNKRRNYAVSLIKEFLLRHTKAEEVRLGSELNRLVWEKGKPPRRIRVKAIKEGSVVKAELLGFEYKEFKALPKKEKKGIKEKLLGRLGPKALKKEEEEKMIEEKKKPEKPEKMEKHEIEE